MSVVRVSEDVPCVFIEMSHLVFLFCFFAND